MLNIAAVVLKIDVIALKTNAITDKLRFGCMCVLVWLAPFYPSSHPFYFCINIVCTLDQTALRWSSRLTGHIAYTLMLKMNAITSKMNAVTYVFSFRQSKRLSDFDIVNFSFVLSQVRISHQSYFCFCLLFRVLRWMWMTSSEFIRCFWTNQGRHSS